MISGSWQFALWFLCLFSISYLSESQKQKHSYLSNTVSKVWEGRFCVASDILIYIYIYFSFLSYKVITYAKIFKKIFIVQSAKFVNNNLPCPTINLYLFGKVT